MSWRYVKFVVAITICNYTCFSYAKVSHIQRVSPDYSFIALDSAITLADIVLPPSKDADEYFQLYLKDKEIEIVRQFLTRYHDFAVYAVLPNTTLTIQEDVLRKGLTYLYVMHPIDTLLLKKLQKAEELARKEKKNIWITQFKILTSEMLESSLSSYKQKFVFTQGVIQDVRYSKGHYYFHFGKDHANDLTCMITQAYWPDLTPNQAKEWIGKSVLVRGWVEAFNGPYIQFYHPSHFMEKE